MAAPKGNKYGEGSTKSGRPREWDREQMAIELLEWGAKDDSINLNGFCCTRKPPLDPSKITLWANEDEGFRQAYNMVKTFIAARREQMLTNETLHVKAYDLNVAVYDYFLRKEKRDQAEFESSLKKQEAEAASIAQEDLHKFMMEWAKSNQNAKTS